jgi:hypothetical protein
MLSEPVGHRKAALRGKLIAINVYIKIKKDLKKLT